MEGSVLGQQHVERASASALRKHSFSSSLSLSSSHSFLFHPLILPSFSRLNVLNELIQPV